MERQYPAIYILSINQSDEDMHIFCRRQLGKNGVLSVCI